MCETKLPVQQLELKVQGAYARGGGGIIAGFYGNKTLILRGEVYLSLLPFTVWQVHMNTVESCDYAPIHGILTFPYDDHYRPSNAMWAHDFCTFSGCLVVKTREKR